VPVPRTFALPAALAALLLAAVAGCGADEEGTASLPEDQQVRAVVARFGVATRARDYQAICDRLLADELVRSVEAVGLPCESALQRGLSDVRDPRLRITQVSVSRGRALVSVHSTAAGQPPSDDALQLVKQGDEWRIASLAVPSGGGAATATTPPATATTPPAATSTTRTSTTKP
jgi:hypothetical protein